MQFTKMHGAGNDFVILNNLDGSIDEKNYSLLAQKLCGRRTSIGADGLMIVVKPEKGGDYGMIFYNSDGSRGEMCGNGARCIARYGYEKGLAGETQNIETAAGLVTGQRLSQRIYKVRLNDPSFTELHRHVTAGGRDFDCAYIELGNPGIPHAVIVMPELEDIDRDELRELGRELRFSPEFPRGANINFVKPLGVNRVKLLTFERGVEDFTLACGTGSGSAAAALSMLGLADGRDVKLLNEGGELSVSLSFEGERAWDIFLSGPTNLVCEGEILDEDLKLI